MVNKFKSSTREPTSYLEQRYRLIENMNYVPFLGSSKKKGEIELNQPSADDGLSTKGNLKSNIEEEKKLSSAAHSKGNDSNRLNIEDSEIKLERIKSEPEPFKTSKNIVEKLDNSDNDEKSDSTQDAPVESQPKFQEDDEEKSDYGASKIVKGGIVTGTDGYYHANINSQKFEDPEGNEDKSRILKVRLMPIKWPSEESDNCSANKISPEGEAILEEDEDKYEVARREIAKEKQWHKREPIESLHLMASFNYWQPIEMKPIKPNKIENQDDAEGEDYEEPDTIFRFWDYFPPGKHYFYFIKNKKYYTLNKRYNIGRFKECKNIWLNYIQVEKDFSRVKLYHEKQKKKATERQDDIRDFFLYKNWKQDDESMQKKMFDIDWGYTKVFRIIKSDEKELNRVRKILWKYYPKIKELFTFESGMSSYPTISWNDFTAFWNHCQLVDKNLNLSSLDMIFIATNVSLHEYSTNAERDLRRYEFLEILVRLAIAKYGSTMPPHEALKTLLDENIFKYCNASEVGDFRK